MRTSLHNPMTPLSFAAALLLAGPALGYEFDDGDRWSRTAVDGSGLSQGDPTTVTWSIAPEGTSVPDNSGGRVGSELIGFFDSLYPGGSGGDLTQRPWFFIFKDSFDRWEALSGLDFVYEENDDGASFSSLNYRRGIVDTRGDIRIGAASLDGQDGGNTLAFAYSPDYAEMVIDTDNTNLYGNTTNTSRLARNVIMHEIGHSLGLEHLESSDARILMEPFISSLFDGPQLDDILAIHRGYGDFYEKSNGGAGNDSAANATPLGTLVNQVTTSIGTDADDTIVLPTDTDFVSIDDNSDTDFYSFTIDAESTLDLTLTPKGPSYFSGPQDGTQSLLVTDELSDLVLALYDTDGSTQLAYADGFGSGDVESINDYLIESPGTYFVRVTGFDNAPQLYQLDLLAEWVIAEPVVGDLDGDGFVDENDLFIVLNNFATSVTPGSLPDGDPTGDGAVGIDDIDFVLARWTGSQPPSSFSVPEPGSVLCLFIGNWVAFRRRRGF